MNPDEKVYLLGMENKPINLAMQEHFRGGRPETSGTTAAL